MSDRDEKPGKGELEAQAREAQAREAETLLISLHYSARRIDDLGTFVDARLRDVMWAVRRIADLQPPVKIFGCDPCGWHGGYRKRCPMCGKGVRQIGVRHGDGAMVFDAPVPVTVGMTAHGARGGGTLLCSDCEGRGACSVGCSCSCHQPVMATTSGHGDKP